MKFTIELGCCPCDEDAVQLSDTCDNSGLMRRQCTAWKNQLLRTLAGSDEWNSANVKLHVKNIDHDFGTYYEVVGSCDDNDEKAINALFWLESNAPQRSGECDGY